MVQGAGGDINGNAVNALFDTGDGNVFSEVVQSDNDLIDGGASDDFLVGSEGNDLLVGGLDTDVRIARTT